MMKKTFTVLFSFLSLLLQAQHNAPYTLHKEGIDGHATLHKSTTAQIKQAFPGGQYSEEIEESDAVIKKGYYQDSLGTYEFYFVNDTLSAILLQKDFPAVIFHNVFLGKTSLTEFRKHHHDRTIVFRKNDSGTMAYYTNGPLNLMFFNPADATNLRAKEDSMILYSIALDRPDNPVRLKPEHDLPSIVQDFTTHFISYDIEFCSSVLSGKLRELNKKEFTDKLVREREKITSVTPLFRLRKNKDANATHQYALAYVFHRIPQGIEETQILYITTDAEGKSITDFYVEVLQKPHDQLDASHNALTLFGNEKWKLNDTIYTIAKTSLINLEMNPRVMMEVLVEHKSPYTNEEQSQAWAYAHGKKFAARLLEEKYLSKALQSCFIHHLEFNNQRVTVIFWDQDTEEYYFTQYKVSELKGK